MDSPVDSHSTSGDRAEMFLRDGGELGELMRAFDWQTTSLGAPARWPQVLKTTVRMALTTRHPIFIFWGPESICLYNDAYRALIGPEKHPRILGRAAHEAWGEIWPVIEPQIQLVMSGQGATWHENQLIPIHRHGALEDVYWTYSYGPIDDPNSQAGVGGVLVICAETTQSVLAQQQRDKDIAQAVFLHDVSEILSRLQNARNTMNQLARYCVGELCGWCVVDLLDENGRAERLARAHFDADIEPLIAEIPQQIPESGPNVSILHRVLQTGEAEFHPEFPAEIIAAISRTEPGRSLIEKVNPKSIISVPLKVRGNTLGAIAFARGPEHPAFDEAQFNLAREIGRLAAVALDNARLYEELQEAHQVKDRFLATLAHELRNPLAPMRNVVQILKSQRQDPERLAKMSDILDRQIRQMTHLIEDLLDVSRVSLGKVTLRTEPIPLATLLDEIIEMAQPMCAETHHRLNCKLTAENTVLEVDRVRIVQVMSNLFSNACKFNKPGAPIDFSVDCANGEVAFRVRDHGIGIAPENRSRLFTMFGQVGETSLHHSGLGIGLALSRSLVHLHAGRMEMQSNGLGKGCEFAVFLPVTTVDPPAEQPAPLPMRNASVRRVLVVDDNEDAAVSLALLLEENSFEVTVAFSGKEALRTIEQSQFDVFIVDLGMPEMDGFELARRIRERQDNQTCQLIALTGWGQDSDRDRTLAAGFDAHVVKPVSIDTLIGLM